MLYIYPICIYNTEQNLIGVIPDLNIKVVGVSEESIIEEAKQALRKKIKERTQMPKATELNKIDVFKTAKRRRILYNDVSTTVISLNV